MHFLAYWQVKCHLGRIKHKNNPLIDGLGRMFAKEHYTRRNKPDKATRAMIASKDTLPETDEQLMLH